MSVVVSYPSGQQDSDSYAFLTVSGTRLVFVTAASSDGDLGGLSGADATCQAAADGASLPGSYLAWLSDGVDAPASRSNQLGGPFALVDLITIVANDWADLTDGTLAHAIDQDQNGTLVSADFPWTNVDSDGTAVSTDPINGHCGAWTSNSGAPTPAGGIGRTTVTDSTWTNLTTTACDTSRPLFCFQE